MSAAVQEYIDKATDERKALFDKIHALIVGLYPDAEIVIWYAVPTYRAKSGHVSVAYWKGGVTVATNNPQHIAEFKAQYPRIATGHASIKFKLKDAIPEAALATVIKNAIEPTA